MNERNTKARLEETYEDYQKRGQEWSGQLLDLDRHPGRILAEVKNDAEIYKWLINTRSTVAHCRKSMKVNEGARRTYLVYSRELRDDITYLREVGRLKQVWDVRKGK